MKLTMSWLKRHLDTAATVAEVGEALTDIGLEVDAIIDPSERLATFTLAKVISAKKHPNADRLVVCDVLTDEGNKEIVCGAPNARAGITVVLAKPGTYVPGIDSMIGIGKIRGVESFGMMCSEREMELSDEHDGIIELDSGAVGERFIDWLQEHRPEAVDPVIEIEITPNRPDALGVHGIARDLAARGLGTLKLETAIKSFNGSTPSIPVEIAPDTISGCPLFTGRVIRGVSNDPSPEWMQNLLKAVGVRPISALVDITNFFTYDQNRPLHVFDADKLVRGLRVHRATGEEQLHALDDKVYQLPQGATIISDDSGPVSIAGIIGGMSTAVTETTKNVFLESALWNPIEIATLGRRLKILSDARYRFERGVDPNYTELGLCSATEMILSLCGGTAESAIVAGEVPDSSRAYKLNPSRVCSLIGMDIEEVTQRRVLKDLGFRVDGDMVNVPSWRPDIMGEADLAEEIARIVSLSNLAAKPLKRLAEGVAPAVLSPQHDSKAQARRTCAMLGYSECLTYSFIGKAAAEAFGGGDSRLMLANPISSELTHMRPSLLPGILQVIARNQARGFQDLAVFEIGPVFSVEDCDAQATCVAGVLVGNTGPRDVHGDSRCIDVFDVKADVEAVLDAAGAPKNAQIRRGAADWWHPGRHGVIGLGPNKNLAIYGELHPRTLAALAISGSAMAFEIYLDELPAKRQPSTSREPMVVSDFQTVERDFSFVVGTRVEAVSIVKAAAAVDRSLIAEVRVFDSFSGENIDAGEKSIAFTVRLEPSQATLVEAEIEKVCSKIIANVQRVTGGRLRE
ncbi:MAG: phenylalanine--tRNA ligase subunit beta [Aestuariivita sp.]|nr:phenylalanine--tRNA ligase subunit beta [Aestuariivita sp.]MCY4202187.1 phenylalanine--tRNA ligase subunit beta [Aestuariivita sp.]MCY4289801.1 phenylalanine--tRNA ligase subunit beta [Aestuariivita sp.]MCY4347429.1 phenylalanine--tRNA ligase subunit beta [Aestuariivita sp.]